MKHGSGYIPGTPGKAQHSFARVPVVNVQRSLFNRSTNVKSTYQEGYIYPFYCDEVLPGDTFSARLTAFLRLSTLLNPIMDNIHADVHFWYVPNRLLWTNWIYFMGEQNNPTDSTSFTIPQVTAPGGGYASESLFDYMGIPTLIASSPNVNALHSRAYNFIWNQEYRDQNLQNSVTFDTGNGPDTASNYVILRRGKRHDYFTSCLPWPQKVTDGTALTVPLSGTAPVTGIGKRTQVFSAGPLSPYESNGTQPTYTIAQYVGTAADDQLIVKGSATTGGYPQIFADLSAASGITIAQLRQSVQLQRFFEKDARGGTRYPELIKSHFGVISPDFRLQRPELLSSHTYPFNIHVVPQTSGTGITGGTIPQGDLAGYGTCSITNCGFTKSFTEHGVILGLISMRADLGYQQGIERMWSRRTRYDFAFPVFAHLGEQSVLNKEIYLSGSSTTDNNVFGYQERYAEYRYKPSTVSGQFRSNFPTTLDSWHLVQNFSALPTLGSTFIQQNAPMSRVLASGVVTHFLSDMFLSLKCARPLPVFSVPGWMDHF